MPSKWPEDPRIRWKGLPMGGTRFPLGGFLAHSNSKKQPSRSNDGVHRHWKVVGIGERLGGLRAQPLTSIMRPRATPVAASTRAALRAWNCITFASCSGEGLEAGSDESPSNPTPRLIGDFTVPATSFLTCDWSMAGSKRSVDGWIATPAGWAGVCGSTRLGVVA